MDHILGAGHLIQSLLCLALTSLAAALPQPVGKNLTYTVKPDDTIFTISRRYGLAPDHVLWANSLTLDRPPQPGTELVIPLRRIPPFTPRESTAVVLNLPERMLYLFRGGRMVKYWGVAIGGPQYPTPVGDFRILAKEKNPTWEPPKWLQKKPIGPGPDNPLGDRWIQITPDMVGIHGTNNPDSIGGVASLGCVRLYPEAVRELYDQVPVGTPVYAIYEQVRVGQETDGTLVWSFFPDPYSKYYTLFQAQEALRQAESEGNKVDVSDFEIKERSHLPTGLLSPVFGLPIQVRIEPPLEAISALKKPTGNWLDTALLTRYGVEVTQRGGKTVLADQKGKKVMLGIQEVPLNPHRLPREVPEEGLQLEGHRWRKTTWAPFPLVLDYFEIPYEWNKESEILQLK